MAPATVRLAPYKDFLQPALHRRFTTVASILLLVAYAETLVLTTWNSLLWPWFPIGPAGLRATVLFVGTLLPILVLRIAQYHLGQRTAPAWFASPSASALLGRLQPSAAWWPPVETVASYGFSAWWFALVYLSAAGGGRGDPNGLAWIRYFSPDRARLNERPLFLTCHLVLVGVLRGVRHVARDKDRLALGGVKRKEAAAGDEGGRDAASPPGSALLATFKAHAPQFVNAAVLDAFAAWAAATVAYAVFLRGPAWGWTVFFMRWGYALPRTNLLPSVAPYWNLPLLGRAFFAGLLLSLLWSACDSCFAILMVKDPLKNGQPLTSEAKDPNGGLLNGLKSKKLSVQCFAMWELAYIATNVPARRKALYEDIDRKDGPAWSQVYGICMSTVSAMDKRVTEYGKSPAPPPLAEAPATFNPADGAATRPARTDADVFAPRGAKPQASSIRAEVEKKVASLAFSPGRTPAQNLSPLGKGVADGARRARDMVLSKEQQALVAPGNLRRLFGGQVRALLANPLLGAPFRPAYAFRARLAAVVLGTPLGEPSLYVNAVAAVTRLATASLAEDRLGNVARDVPPLVRTLTQVIGHLDAFKSAGMPLHWADVEGKRDSPETDEILAALREGLGEVVTEFGPYSADLGLSLKDMRLAREAAGWPKEAEKKKGTEKQEVVEVKAKEKRKEKAIEKPEVRKQLEGKGKGKEKEKVPGYWQSSRQEDVVEQTLY